MDTKEKVEALRKQIEQLQYLQSQGAPYPRALGTPIEETYESKIDELEDEISELLGANI